MYDDTIFKITKIDGYNSIDFISISSPDAVKYQIDKIQQILKDCSPEINIISYKAMDVVRILFDVTLGPDQHRWEIICDDNFEIISGTVEETEVSIESRNSVTAEAI